MDEGGGGGEGSSGGGGERMGWHGLSQAAHIVQEVWSLDIAFIVDIADETLKCEMERRVKREKIRTVSVLGLLILILTFSL